MRAILSALLLLFVLNSQAQQVGKTFPKINGFDLSDKALTLPQKNGKYTIVAIAYLREAEPEMRKWLNPLFEEFVNKDKGALDMSDGHDVNFYFVPMISGLKNAKMDYKNNTDKGFWPYVMDTDKYDIKGMQKELGVENPKIPYFYVLDKDGKIVNVQSGKYTEEKMEQMGEAIK
jgi:hypothetical protein